MSDRSIRQSSRMSQTEALMWAAESDPYLSSGMGSLFVLDTAPDFDRFVDTLLDASVTLRRLREKVDDSIAVAAPRWVLDPEFDIYEHVRRVKLPGGAGLDELTQLAAQVFQDPFDPNRPLWQFVVVEGGRSKRSISGAIILKVHHSVSDGIVALRLAEMYLDLERDPSPRSSPAQDQPDVESRPPGFAESVLGEIDFLVRQQLDLTRQVAAEVSLWGADPARARRAVREALNVGRGLSDAFDGGFGDDGGSPLWKNRSRHRHLEVFDLDLAEVKGASKRLGVSINDLFVGGSVLAAARYHEEHDVHVERFNLSFITSTRTDDAAAGNSFVPVPFSVQAGVKPIEDHLDEVRATMTSSIEDVSEAGLDLMERVSGFANLLPETVVSKAGRRRAARQDWATSNLRGTPFPLYVAGGEVTAMYPVGPVAGTGFNLTAMSYNGAFHFGLHVDPVAVTDPEVLSHHLQQAYADVLAL